MGSDETPGEVVRFPRRHVGGEQWEPWVDEQALARHFSVSTRTVRRWRAAGMPSLLVGGVRRYRIGEAERLASRARRKPVIRVKNGKLIVEVYDPTTQKKVYVRPSDHGVQAPKTKREATALERLATEAIETRAHRAPVGEETVGSFLLDPWSNDGVSGRGRWTRDYRNNRGESTLIHNSERVRRFAEQYRDRTLRLITRTEARQQAAAHEGTIPALRAAWSDALRDGLVEENVFADLGIERRRGREEIIPLLMEEVHRLAEIATELYGTGTFGQEVSPRSCGPPTRCAAPARRSPHAAHSSTATPTTSTPR